MSTPRFTSSCVLLTDRCGIYFDMQDIDGTDARLATDDGIAVALKDVSAARVICPLLC